MQQPLAGVRQLLLQPWGWGLPFGFHQDPVAKGVGEGNFSLKLGWGCSLVNPSTHAGHPVSMPSIPDSLIHPASRWHPVGTPSTPSALHWHTQHLIGTPSTLLAHLEPSSTPISPSAPCLHTQHPVRTPSQHSQHLISTVVAALALPRPHIPKSKAGQIFPNLETWLHCHKNC